MAMRWGLAAALFLVGVNCASASATTQPSTVPVVMLSDPHFDPFQDPGKVQALLSAPVNDWVSILNQPASSTQADDFTALQKTCHARGVDSSWEVLNGALQAAHKQESKPLFVTVTGDLLTHGFECRLRTLVPSTTPEQLSQFAQKTLAFVALQLREAFPGTPVYLALGNNDSGCGNYHQSRGSEFLRGAAESIVADASNKRQHDRVLPLFDDQEDYVVTLPRPMRRARLIVLQDVAETPDFQDCAGNKVTDPATAQITWLRAQLASARRDHEHVWVMAHIPPGVDAYASFHKYISTPDRLCEVTSPTPMLSSEQLSDALTEFADVVRLGLFAHTHMDEIKLLRNHSGEVVPAKLVPSISPVNGNHPAFTVAQVQPQSAMLVDYEVFASGDLTASSWSEEYKFSTAYKLADFSGSSVLQLASALAKDKQGDAASSQLYQKWFFPGDNGDYASGLHKIWPSYACGALEDGGPVFHDCMCLSTPSPNAPEGSRQ